MELKIQFENGKIVHLKIGRKYHENNGKLRIGGMKKKAVCKTARRAHSQKKINIVSFLCTKLFQK